MELVGHLGRERVDVLRVEPRHVYGMELLVPRIIHHENRKPIFCATHPCLLKYRFASVTHGPGQTAFLISCAVNFSPAMLITVNQSIFSDGSPSQK